MSQAQMFKFWRSFVFLDKRAFSNFGFLWKLRNLIEILFPYFFLQYMKKLLIFLKISEIKWHFIFV